MRPSHPRARHPASTRRAERARRSRRGGRAGRGGRRGPTCAATRPRNTRFADNEMTTSGRVSTRSHSRGRDRHRQAPRVRPRPTRPTSASAERCVERAATMARLSPEDPESMPLLRPQTYAPAPAAFDERAATMRPTEPRGDRDARRWRGRHARACRSPASSSVTPSSRGARARRRACARVTRDRGARTRSRRARPTRTGSGWAGRGVEPRRRLRRRRARAHRRRQGGAAPRGRARFAPGKYTVILEPQAVAEMLAFLVGAMNLRSADEGRSFFSGKVGEKLFPDIVTLRSDPSGPARPARRSTARAPRSAHIVDRRRAREGPLRVALLGAEEGPPADAAATRASPRRRRAASARSS